MKKAFYSVLTTVMVLVFLSACGKKDDGGGSAGDGGGTIAGTPAQPCNIPGNTGCTPNVYQQYAPNFQAYQYGNANGFCGCPAGYRAVMNMQWGISCAPENWFPNYAYYYSYNYRDLYAAQNNQWTSIPQVTYSPANSGYNSTCATAASVCDTRLTTPTGTNPQCGNVNGTPGYCRASAGGSYIGLCTGGTGNESYNNPYGGYGCMRPTYYGWINVCGTYNNSYGGGAYGGGAYGYYGGGGAGQPR